MAVPTFVITTLDPAAPVSTVPTATLAASPVTPLGISKSNTAASTVPLLLTAAGVKGATVVTLPIVIVAKPSGFRA